MFRKLLIANRGEIACRIIRTAHALGIRCVAVYSDADAGARHVVETDEAYHIGPSPSRQSYLNQDKLIEVAKITGADAVHPGYGFLAENAGFCRRVREAGMTFVGPPPEAIDAMGSKSEAKSIVSAAGVPLMPGYHGDNQDPEFLAEKVKEIGFPVLIKAAFGGGGKGMRIVREESEVVAALTQARSEAESAFGDGKLLVEKYLEGPRHVEVQIFADDQGHCIYLADRDCSIQRRHQKIIEEAPAPGLSDALRREMGEAAVRAAQAIDYRGAGTIEFLLDRDHKFYFMEMNTRLQVEHPVTEMITGQDLVKWQLLVASGEPLPLTQAEVRVDGHAIEARIYAEDPDNDFRPDPGRISYLAEPIQSRHVRVDSGVRENDEISAYYDPMIAKLACWDESRPLAIRRINRALEEYRVVGVATNLEFLSNILDSRPFYAGQLTTGFIADFRHLIMDQSPQSPQRFLALATLYLAEHQAQQEARRTGETTDPFSPWASLRAWRLNGPATRMMRLVDGQGHEHLVGVLRERNGYRLDLEHQEVWATARLESRQLLAELDGHLLKATITSSGGSFTVQFRHQAHTFTQPTIAAVVDEESTDGQLVAPINGIVVSIQCKEGDKVARGAALMVIEAMKMQHTICAPHDGEVKEVPFQVGDQVQEGQPLLVLEGAA